MNILSFVKKFPTEESCKQHFIQQRNKSGINCKKCKENTKHYWLEAISKWQCSNCESRTCLRAGTIMEYSKLPIQTWYTCMHLMTSTKKPFSALEMQRQLEHKYYEPVLNMMHKIRAALGKRDKNYTLSGNIEIDDAFYTTVDLPEKDRLGNVKYERGETKRGRGSERQSSVMVMVESTPVGKPNRKHGKSRVMGFIKMIQVDDLNNKGINYEIERSIDPAAKVITDMYRGYSKLNQHVAEHKAVEVKPKQAMTILPWVHTMIANSKRQILGVHHSVHAKYLQNYLNEFCYKLNRRNIDGDLFDRLIGAGVSDTWY